MLKTKSVTSAINKKEDGIRLLVTRFRGRGLPARRQETRALSEDTIQRTKGAVLAGWKVDRLYVQRIRARPGLYPTVPIEWGQAADLYRWWF